MIDINNNSPMYGKYNVLSVNENSSKEEITVSELRDFLNELIEAGYSDLKVETDVNVISLRDRAFIRKTRVLVLRQAA